MTGEWHWDDESIPSTDVLYRHVPRKTRLDPITGEWSLTLAAFTADEMREDGWSIYREGLMRRHGLTISDIEASGSAPREVWAFEVADVRCVHGCGVIDQEDRSKLPLGAAHGLVRCDSPRPTKRKIAELRNRLIDRARLA